MSVWKGGADEKLGALASGLESVMYSQEMKSRVLDLHFVDGLSVRVLLRCGDARTVAIPPAGWSGRCRG
ncbi:hypothetical protein [Bifidobacterium margollesii]|uniref:hypothetical protein n=1 Tax=Bifidobacterium margollesii TaxID=2020964 RepID=UPI00105564BB|nr:hypothetical protein [Bifidobacterium margollesii]